MQSGAAEAVPLDRVVPEKAWRIRRNDDNGGCPGQTHHNGRSPRGATREGNGRRSNPKSQMQWLQRKERAASGVAQATTRDVSTFETPSAWPASQQHHVGRQLSRPSGFHHP